MLAAATSQLEGADKPVSDANAVENTRAPQTS